MASTFPCVSFEVNRRRYRVGPYPVVVICVDGCAEEHLSAALAHREMRTIRAMSRQGYYGLARSALPSFTNVNNCAIVTGTPPSQTGIPGNFILDPVTGRELMTNEPEFLRNETVLARAARAGRKVAMVTAKDKLRRLLSKDLDGIAFSSECVDPESLKEAGILDASPDLGLPPKIYSAEASLYVLRAGVEILKKARADFLYLTTTDFMQHKHAPDEDELLDFYQHLDDLIGELLELGAVVGITADHGMNAKCDQSGKPQVIFLEAQLEERFGPGFRVICPITDPYVAHHGALGSAVLVYLPNESDSSEVGEWIRRLKGVTEVHDRDSAERLLELPMDLIGDLFVLSGRDWVLGRRAQDHDLSQLAGSLRSHGGRYEEMVPLLTSCPLTEAYRRRAMGDPRNFDIFDFVCNGLQSSKAG